MADRKESKAPYISGHCGIGHHQRCAGDYAGTKCHCECGHAKEGEQPNG